MSAVQTVDPATFAALGAPSRLRIVELLREEPLSVGAIAERLGIESDDDHDPDDARFGVYDWLGYRLELVIEAADALL